MCQPSRERRCYTAVLVAVLCTTSAFVAWQVYGKPLPVREDVVLKSYQPIVMNGKEVKLITLRRMTAQIQADCPKWEYFGPHWVDKDGGWAVCMARPFIPRKPCTVYSFGIKYDWAFDDAYRKKFGCIVRTFDPSMGKTVEHEHKPGVYFYPMGLSDRKEVDPRGWTMDSFRGFLTHFGDQNKIIPYLKFDVELSEWKVLDNMLSDGSLKNVMQLAFEMHIPKKGNDTECFYLLKRLEAQGFLRWFGHHHFIHFSRYFKFRFQSDQVYINTNFLPNSKQYVT